MHSTTGQDEDDYKKDHPEESKPIEQKQKLKLKFLCCIYKFINSMIHFLNIYLFQCQFNINQIESVWDDNILEGQVDTTET